MNPDGLRKWAESLRWKVVYDNQTLAGIFDEAAHALELAIAHDRQPYPTAAAYEEVCAALEDKRKRLEAAEKKAAEWAGWCESHKIAIDVYATDNAVLRKRLEVAEQSAKKANEDAGMYLWEVGKLRERFWWAVVRPLIIGSCLGVLASGVIVVVFVWILAHP
jgi:hypothetical protein